MGTGHRHNRQAKQNGPDQRAGGIDDRHPRHQAPRIGLARVRGGKRQRRQHRWPIGKAIDLGESGPGLDQAAESRPVTVRADLPLSLIHI